MSLALIKALSVMGITPNLATDVALLNASLKNIVFVDMNNDDYTMTDAEAYSYLKIILNGGSGKTLTWPTSADSLMAIPQTVIGDYLSAPITLSCQTGGATETLNPLEDTELAVAPGVAIVKLSRQYAVQANNAINGNYEKTADWDINIDHYGQLGSLTGAVNKTVTFTLANVSAMPANTRGWLRRTGAGTLTIAGSGGVTISGNTSPAQNQIVMWVKDNVNADTIIVG